MSKIVLATKRRWNWKVFAVLVGLTIPATFAILPYSLSLQNAASGWETLVVDQLINGAVLGGIGLILANRIGLGMPFVEAWVKHEPIARRFRSTVAIAWIAAVVLVLVSIFLHAVVFDPPMKAMFEELGIAAPTGASMPPLYGFLAAFSAGITEETLFRLFGLSLLAWLGGLFFHEPDGRPKLTVFWTANLLLALAFGAAHLPTAAAMGVPLNALVITGTLVLNALGGLAFGWLFWTFGLESAILAHFFADVITKAMIPFVTMQSGPIARSLVMAALVVTVLFVLVWARGCLILEGHRRHPQTAN